MPNTFTLISSVTVNTSIASSIDFTSIPSTYTDLCVKFSIRGDNSAAYGFYITLNSSTSSFTTRWVEGNGSGINTGTTARFIAAETPSSATSNTFCNGELYIPNYAGSNYKSISTDNVTENNSTTAYTDLNSNLWSNTAAITSLSLVSGSPMSFVRYSTAYLYGIKNS